MSTANLIDIDGLGVDFRSGGAFSLSRSTVRAVIDVDLVIGHSHAVGLVGESGSGKTTLGRCVLGLQEPTSGRVVVNGEPLTTLSRRADDLHRQIQVVFQNPTASLNPTMTVRQILREPLVRLAGLDDKGAVETRSRELIEDVQLSADVLDRRPHALSGGMCQRVSIARALAPEPDLIVLDEAVSALDVATQAQIINLLADLRDRTGVSYLFIAHDLAVVRHLCDEIAVMQTGRIVETGPAAEICTNPRSEYTQKLLMAVPVPDPNVKRIRTSTFGRDNQGAADER